MGDNELLYIMLAIMFFGGLSTSMNKFLAMNNEEMLQKEYEYQAVAIAQGIIETVKARKFDENMTPPEKGYRPNAPPLVFESPYAMTQESEKWENFDDIDDYSGGWNVNHYKPLKTTMSTRLGDFDVSTLVYYVDASNLSVPTKNRSYFKKLIVIVSNEHLERDIKLEHIYGFLNLN